MTKDFRKKFYVLTPNEPPYALTFSIVRLPGGFRRGHVRLRATDSSEIRKTPVRRLYVVMSIGDQASIECHCLPLTPNEGGIYLLTKQIELPAYGTYHLKAVLEIYLPVLAIIGAAVEDTED